MPVGPFSSPAFHFFVSEATTDVGGAFYTFAFLSTVGFAGLMVVPGACFFGTGMPVRARPSPASEAFVSHAASTVCVTPGTIIVVATPLQATIVVAS